METSTIKGVIIKSIDYKESSKIIYVLTNNNVQSILVRGAKKLNSKFKSFILSYNYVECYVTNSKLPILTDIEVCKEYTNIKTNINKNKSAGLVINTFLKENYENPKIYDLVLKTLDYINDSDEIYYSNLFLLKNLHFIGFEPRFKCNCGSTELIGFNIKEGIGVCKNCNISSNIDKEFTYKLYELLYSKYENKVEIDNELLKNFLKKYYEIHTTIKI